MYKGVILDEPPKVLTARVRPEFSNVIDSVSMSLGMSKSEFLRRALRAVFDTVATVTGKAIEGVPENTRVNYTTNYYSVSAIEVVVEQ